MGLASHFTSLKNRLIAAAAVWVVVGVAIAGVSLSAIFRSYVTSQFHEELAVHLDELDGLLDPDAKPVPQLSRPFSDPRYIPPLSGFYWQIKKGDAVIARSLSLAGRDIVIGPHEPVRKLGDAIDGPTGPLIIAEKRHLPEAGEILQVVIGTDSRHLEGLIAQYHSSLFWSLGAFAASIIGAAVLLITFAMRPLTKLRGSLADVRRGSTAKLAGGFPQEVAPLVDDLNNLIDEANQTTQRARVQAGNLAHGLKTPLAILTDEARQLEARGDAQTAALILDQCRKMRLHIDYHIARARVVGQRAGIAVATDVRPVVLACQSALARLHAQRALHFAVNVPFDIRAACDAEDLYEMVANLLDNACKHAVSQVDVCAIRDGEAVLIQVDDDGPGLPLENREAVFSVGERLRSDLPGSGLGLPIVRDVARLCGGDAWIESAPSGGARACLRLPFRTSMASSSEKANRS